VGREGGSPSEPDRAACGAVLQAVQDASDHDIWRRERTDACRVFEALVTISSDETATGCASGARGARVVVLTTAVEEEAGDIE
jgi:hypothetical protein